MLNKGDLMKKILIASLFCSVALFMSACSDENKELSQDAFKFNIKNTKNGLGMKMQSLTLTAKDDIEIKRITANRGGCHILDYKLMVDSSAIGAISDETSPKVCNDGILNENWISSCYKLVKWAELSKEDCSYEYEYDIDKSEDFKRINERVEKTEDEEYIENCEKAKQVAKEKYNGKYYYDYKMPLKFGESREYVTYNDENCSTILEFSIYTNKGVVTYSVN